MRKIILTLLIVLNLSIIGAQGFTEPIIINESGVQGTDLIVQNGNVFTFTAEINKPIVIEVDDIILDGDGHVLRTTSSIDSIYVEEQNNVRIFNMDIWDGKNGVLFINSTNCEVSNCNITDTTYDGIRTDGICPNLEVSHNRFYEVPRNGISIRGQSPYANIYGNSIIRVDHVGILLETSNYSIVHDNYIADQEETGIVIVNSAYCKVTRNYIEKGGENGIWMGFKSRYNEISENIVTNNGHDGIKINDSFFNVIISNIVSDNDDDGIDFEEAHNNTLIKNDIIGHEYGIDFELSTDNTITNNNIDNQYSVTYTPKYIVNNWNSEKPIGGNYWADYSGIDADNDGFGDSPYELYRDTFGIVDEDNLDQFPLMEPFTRASHITLNIAQTEIYPDEQILISGTLNPDFGRLNTVIVSITSPSGTNTEEIVSDELGYYSFDFKPETVGQWTFSSSWAGDEIYAESNSDEESLTVNPYQISLQASPSELVKGEEITVSGLIIPPRDGESVSFEIKSRDDTFTGSTMTNNGGFSYSISPDISGEFTITGSWKTASDSATVTISEPEPEPEPELEPEETSGGIPLSSTSVLVGIATYLLIKKRE